MIITSEVARHNYTNQRGELEQENYQGDTDNTDRKIEMMGA